MAEPTLEELGQQIAAKDKAIADLIKRVEGIDELKGKWSNEVGDSRKKIETFESQVTEMKKVIDGLKEDRDSLKSELESLKSNKPGSGGGQKPPANEPSDKEVADALESQLTDEQKAEVEKALADEKDASDFVKDDTFRRAVLERVVNAGGGKKVSLWRVKKAESNDDLDERVKKLLKKDKGEPLPIDRKGGSGIRVIEAKDSRKREPVSSWT